MSNETYSLVLNSQNATNRVNNASTSSISYNINWDNVLPRKYSQYSLNWQLKSNNVSTIIVTGTINTNVLTTTGIYPAQTLAVGLVISTPTGYATVNTVTNATTYTLSTTPNVATATAFYSLNNQFVNSLACSINFGKILVSDQSNSQNNCIGFVYPSITNVAGNFSQYSYYASTLDNGNIQIAYPTNQNITVSFTNLDLSTIPSFTNYVLQLYFTPIITDQEAINNASLLAGKF